MAADQDAHDGDNARGDDDKTVVAHRRQAPSRTIRAARIRPVAHVVVLIWLSPSRFRLCRGFANSRPIRAAASRLRFAKEWLGRRAKLSGLVDASCPSRFAGVVGDAAAAVLSDCGGVASPDDPAGGLVPLDPPAARRRARRRRPRVPPATPLRWRRLAALRPARAGTSLPRMIGSPSLPEPMITILVLGDCANCSVASMPRQRRYGIRNPLAHRLLERGDAVGLDLFALRFLGFALDPEFVFLDHVVLLGLAIDRRHDIRRQFDRQHERVEDLDRVLQEVVVVLGVRLLHRLRLHQLVEIGGEALLRIVADLLLDRLARRIDLLAVYCEMTCRAWLPISGSDDRIQIIRTDEFVQHGDGIVQQLIAHADLRAHADAVLGNGVVGLGGGLQP